MSLSLSGFGFSRPRAASRSLSPEAAFAVLAGAAVFAAVLWLPVVLGDPDTLWHITTGKWILAHREVPGLDTYSFTAAGRPWVAHEWLSEVILALGYGWAEWTGVMILTAAAAGCAIGCVAFYVRLRGRLDIAVMLVLLAVACGGPSLLSRPHLIALPLVALWTMGLVSARARGAAPSFMLLPLMTVWANLHGGFLIGLVLAGALGVEAVFDPAGVRRDAVRGWGVFILAAVAAAVITPHGIDGLLFPFRLMSMKNLYQIQEWKPSDFSHLNGVTLSILLALYLGLTGAFRLPKFRVLLVAGLVFATMQHARNGQVFGIIVPLLIADSFGRDSTRLPLKPRLTEAVMVWLVGPAAVLSLVFRLGLPLERVDFSSYPAAALASVPTDLRARPVLNEYGFGGLLIFEGVRPFIDGRADLYGDDFLDIYLSITHAKGNVLDEALCRYDIQWTMFSADSVVPVLMDRTPGWHRLYTDKIAIIHVRDQQANRPACPAQGAD
jgi:hypothetical protein